MRYDLTGKCGVGYTNSGVRFLFDLENYEKIKENSWCVSKGYLHGCASNYGTWGRADSAA